MFDNVAVHAQMLRRSRRVIAKEDRLELVALQLPAGQELGLETHDGMDQTFVVLEGSGIGTVGTRTVSLERGDAMVVVAGVPHNVRATTDLSLYTFYTPLVPGVFDHAPSMRRELRAAIPLADEVYVPTLQGLLNHLEEPERHPHAAMLVESAERWVDFVHADARLKMRRTKSRRRRPRSRSPRKKTLMSGRGRRSKSPGSRNKRSPTPSSRKNSRSPSASPASGRSRSGSPPPRAHVAPPPSPPPKREPVVHHEAPSHHTVVTYPETPSDRPTHTSYPSEHHSTVTHNPAPAPAGPTHSTYSETHSGGHTVISGTKTYKDDQHQTFLIERRYHHYK